MAVKVIIKRQIKEGKWKPVNFYLKKLRNKATEQKGHIYSETIINHSNPCTLTIISEWNNMESWEDWKKNEARNKIEGQLSDLLEKPTEYEEYVFSKYWMS